MKESIFNPHFILKRFQRKKFEKFLEHFKGYVLDVGSGSKPYKKFLNCEKYISVDSEYKLKPDAVADVCFFPFKDGVFDTVIATEILEHVFEKEKFFIELKRVLKKDGYLYITVPQSWPLHYRPYDYWRFTRYSLKKIGEKYFKIQKIERIGGFFSLIGVFTIDFIYNFIKKILFFFPLKISERITAIFIFPFQIIFLILSNCDSIEDSYSIGWLILLKK